MRALRKDDHRGRKGAALFAVLAGCAAAAAASSPSISIRSPAANTVVSATVTISGIAAPTPGGLYWGAAINSQTYGLGSAPWNMQSITMFESHAHKGISLYNWGMNWYASRTWPAGSPQTNYPNNYYPFLPAIMNNLLSHGTIPLLTWMPSDADVTGVNQPNFKLATIIQGTHDAYIRQWATDAKKWGHPFFLRFMHEMDGVWYPWSEGVNGNTTGQSVQAWRHVHDIFRQVGATNVTWVWCPVVEYNPTNLSTLYPGDDYVDWTGIDGYNWGVPAKGGWVSFTQLFQKTYAKVVTIAPNRPLLIVEVASAETPGNKASWINSMFGELQTKYSYVGGIAWFNWNFQPGTSFVIESSTTSEQAFVNDIASPFFLSNQFTALPLLAPVPMPAGVGSGISKVEVQVDSGPFNAATGQSSWSWSWVTGSVPNGTHTLTARVTDFKGRVQTATVHVSVSNKTCDVNNDGLVNVLDVQRETQAALGQIPCYTNLDLNGDGVCNLIDVQRVLTAIQGGACVIGP